MPFTNDIITPRIKHTKPYKTLLKLHQRLRVPDVDLSIIILPSTTETPAAYKGVEKLFNDMCSVRGICFSNHLLFANTDHQVTCKWQF